MPYIGVSPQFGVRRKHTYTATASQTSFSGAGAEGATLSYTDSNFVDVYQNGVKLGDADYTSTSGTAIVLGTGATVNDIIEIIVFDAFSAADTVSKADGGQFDGNITMGGTLAVTGTTALTGNATMAGTLGVTGTQTNNGNLVVSKAIPNVDIKDTGTAQSSMDFLSNSDTVRATIGMERSAGGGLFVGSSAYSAVFGTASSGNTEFATNNNIRMVIDSSGNVGIGTTSPATLLHVENSGGNGSMQLISSTTGTSFINMGDTGDADAGQLSYINNDNAMAFKTNAGERMRIDSSGNVMIGETSQINGGKLNIATSAEGAVLSFLCRSTTDSHQPEIVMQKSSTDSGNFAATADGESLGSIKFRGVNTSAVSDIGAEISVVQDGTSSSTVPTTMRFSTNETERMRIVNEGLLINTTATLHSGVERSLEVLNHGSNGFVAIFKGDNKDHETVAIHNSDTSGTRILLAFKTSGSTGTLVGRVTSDGSTTNYATSSDYRLKENVTYDFDATTRLKQLKPARFNWIADESNSTVDGFIAHEVSSIVPEAVNGEKDAVDSDGNIDPQGIDQAKLVPLLTKTLQEALTRIDTLEAEVKTLKGE